jgi:hypothetical protein
VGRRGESSLADVDVHLGTQAGIAHLLLELQRLALGDDAAPVHHDDVIRRADRPLRGTAW